MKNLLLILLVIGISSCGEEQKKAPKKTLTRDQVNYLSVQMNTWDQKKENDEIDQYIKNHQWTMTQTTSGMRYMYMKKGSGEQTQLDDYVTVSYKVYLLDGTLCYSSDTNGVKEFHVGHDNIESGLHEAVQLMKIGDQLRIVLPSNLAHGLTGDQSKIPAFHSVMYEMELLSIRKNK